jgi:translation initiation factor 1
MTSKERETLLKQLKTRFGAGGAVKDAVIEIQGDHRDGVISVLEGLGYRPKRTGG